MRLKVKKWGNGIALRPPRHSSEYGTLEEGTEVEVVIRPVKKVKDWKPLTFDSGFPDFSQRIDEIAWGWMDEKYGPSKVKP